MAFSVNPPYEIPNTGAALHHPSALRRLDIDRAKGFAIVLVVIGHLCQYHTEIAPLWYIALSRLIYSFHMPFFMYLSGFVFIIGSAPEKTGESYRRYLLARLDRLIVPFVCLGLIIIFGKYAFSTAFRMHGTVSSPLDGLWDMVSNTPTNPTLSVWYMLVLFVYCLITPPLFQLLRRQTVGLVIVATCLYFVPLTGRFYLERIMHFYVYFCAGCIVGHYWQRFQPAFDKYWVASLAFFLVVLSCFVPNAIGLVNNLPWPATFLICGFASMPAIHGLMRRRPFSSSGLLLYLGHNSMVIYLFNTIAIGLVKGLYYRVLPSSGVWFLVMVVVLLVAGIVFPIAVRHNIDRFKFLTPIRRYVM